MAAFLVLLLAALSRLVPHAMHGVGLNFTAVGAGLLFFGSRRPRWQALIAAAVMALTDVVLTKWLYTGFAFHVQDYLVTWAWYGAAALLGNALLRKVSVLRVIAGVFASATSFFLISNLMVWATSQVTYAHTMGGLMQCYAAGLPFYGNDLLSTGILSAALFGLPVAARLLAGQMQAAERNTLA